MPIQDAIFSLEAERGRRLTQWVAVAIGLAAMVLVHMAGQFRGLRHAEAMDQAQLARNIARGRGYTTQVLRPLELGEKLKWQNGGVLKIGALPPGRFEDTRNPPLYPAALAGLFLMTFQDFSYGGAKGEGGGGVQHYFPDRLVAGFGLACLIATAGFLFALGKSVFDRKAAILAVLLFLGSDVVWQLALSGLDASFMMMLLCASVWAWHKALAAEETPEGSGSLAWLALGAGLMALMVLGRYGWWWVVLPCVLLAAFCFRNRYAAVGLVVAIWLVVPGVWFVRNIFISGNPLGTALWMPIEGTDLFPNETLWAQMQPDLSRMTVKKPVGVLLRNFRFWLERWPVVSGGLVPACFFVVGLLHRFRRTRAEALKWWTGGALVVAIAGGGMGAVRDYSAYEPGNMAVLFAPVVALFGAAVVLVMLDRAQIEIVELRRGLLGLVVALNALPLVLTILPPKEPPVCWPPYFGQIVRLVGGFFDEKEVVASDIPEAVAWYGDRSSLMVPPTVKQFNEINDFVLTGATKGLLFSPVTLDGRLFTEVLSGAGREWAGLYLQRRVPELFPLRSGTALPPRLGDMFGYLLYADSPRWQKFVPQTPAGAAAPAGGAQAPAGGEGPRTKAGGGNP